MAPPRLPLYFIVGLSLHTGEHRPAIIVHKYFMTGMCNNISLEMLSFES